MKVGKVIFAGAGCGDPELITVKAANYLSKAHVIVTDRLVSPFILQKYASPQCEIIFVGKEGGKKNSTTQKSINDLLVQLALKNKLVVRLKGGDVSVFSNILDELIALKERNIPYEIIPGITAALGASAYSGIPLTARGYSTAVRLLAFHQESAITDWLWEELAHTGDTLVFYMSAAGVDQIVEQLRSHGIRRDKLIAVIEQATTPEQKVYVSNLYDYVTRDYLSPAIVIVGRVVSLHNQFRWLENKLVPTSSYFETIEDK